MRDKIWIAPPMQPGRHGVTTRQLRESQPIEVKLVDGSRVLDDVQELITKAEKSNLQIKAIVLGAVSYVSLEEAMAEIMGRMYRDRKAADPNGFVINGIEFMIDPTRDEGAPVAVYGRASGIDAFALRKVRENRVEGK